MPVCLRAEIHDQGNRPASTQLQSATSQVALPMKSVVALTLTAIVALAFVIWDERDENE